MVILPLGDNVEKRSFPFVTLLLIVANTALYLNMSRQMMDDPTGYAINDFIMTWALIPNQLADDRWITLFTSMFLHGDLFHLLGNMIVLWAFALTMEDALGSLGFVLLYCLCGIGGGLAEAFLGGGGDIPVIGASGAIAGIIGGYCMAFGPSTRIKTLIWCFRAIRTEIPTCGYALIWLGMQYLGVLSSAPGEPGVAWLAHLGGFGVGTVAVLLFQQLSDKKVVTRRDGTLGVEVQQEEVVARNSDSLLDTAEAELAEAMDVPCCNYCNSQLDEAPQIADNLFRCANPECERLNLVMS